MKKILAVWLIGSAGSLGAMDSISEPRAEASTFQNESPTKLAEDSVAEAKELANKVVALNECTIKGNMYYLLHDYDPLMGLVTTLIKKRQRVIGDINTYYDELVVGKNNVTQYGKRLLKWAIAFSSEDAVTPEVIKELIDHAVTGDYFAQALLLSVKKKDINVMEMDGTSMETYVNELLESRKSNGTGVRVAQSEEVIEEHVSNNALQEVQKVKAVLLLTMADKGKALKSLIDFFLRGNPERYWWIKHFKKRVSITSVRISQDDGSEVSVREYLASCEADEEKKAAILKELF